MLCSYIVYKLHDKYCLTYAGTAEKTDFTTLCIRCDKVNNFDTCFENLRSALLLIKLRRLSVDTPLFFSLRCRHTVYSLTEKVENSSECTFTYRNCYSRSGVNCFNTSLKTVRRTHRNTSYNIVTELLFHFAHNFISAVHYFNSIQKIWHLSVIEFDINDRPYYLYYFSNIFAFHIYVLSPL